MTAKEAEKALQQLVEPVLKRHGFRHQRRLEFLRHREEQIDRIGFNVFTDRNGTVRASFGIGIRFPAVENCRKGDTDADAPTVAVPMHFLEPQRRYFDWQLSDDTDWAILRDEITRAFEDRALPFLMRFSLDAVATDLESEQPAKWFTLDPTARIETLALIDCARGQLPRGIARIETELARLAGAPSKERTPLERLRDRLRSQAPS
jgi:hypothetical protein